MTSKRRSSRKRRPIPHRNKDSTGIWIASFIMRCESKGEDLTNLRRRCVAWENTVILKASDREEAYQKANRIGRADADGRWYKSSGGGRARWVYEGLTELLPVYEELADGSELYYRSFDSRSVETIKSFVKRKRELDVFDDREPLTT